MSAIDESQWQWLLQVTRQLAAPFDLHDMLTAVASETRALLAVERASVWLLGADAVTLTLSISADAEPVQLPIGQGLVGACAATRQPVVVHDCYQDPRFNPEVDRRTGFHTRQCLCLPLLDTRGQPTGVLQCLNAASGVFDEQTIALGTALAAQCAVALQRVQAEADRRSREALEAQLVLAREVQRASLPPQQLQVPGWDLYTHFQPADATGGDTYDCQWVGDRLLLVLADAAGHGLAPALAVLQMQSMLRTALQLGADLATAVHQVNRQLEAQLPDALFITAFIGLLEPASGLLSYVNAGQSPVMIARDPAGLDPFLTLKAQLPPLGMAPWRHPPHPQTTTLARGETLVLMSDGVYEAEDVDGRPFGPDAVLAAYRSAGRQAVGAVAEAVLAALTQHRGPRPFDDDITAVWLRRNA